MVPSSILLNGTIPASMIHARCPEQVLRIVLSPWGTIFFLGTLASGISAWRRLFASVVRRGAPPPFPFHELVRFANGEAHDFSSLGFHPRFFIFLGLRFTRESAVAIAKPSSPESFRIALAILAARALCFGVSFNPCLSRNVLPVHGMVSPPFGNVFVLTFSP